MSSNVDCALCDTVHPLRMTRVVRFGVSEDGYACPRCAADLREMRCEGCGQMLNTLSSDPEYSWKRVDLRQGAMPTDLCTPCRQSAECQRKADKAARRPA